MVAADTRLLVIDDVEENCEILKRRLEKEGYKVEIAADGQEGLLQLGRKDFDLIFLDLDMPVMNGFTFLEKVKSHKKYSDIPVVILSSLDDEDTAKDCLMYGACGYVYKPYDMDKVLVSLKNCLKNNEFALVK